MYKSYYSSLTRNYNGGYIFTAYINGIEVVRYTVDQYAYVQYAKSYRAAQIAITRHKNKSRQLNRQLTNKR